MKILIAPNGFKDFASADRIALWMRQGTSKRYPSARIETMPLADGGEGTVRCLTLRSAGRFAALPSVNPVFEPVSTIVGYSRDQAFIEIADVAGGRKVSTPWNTLETTSYGLGASIVQLALEPGVSKIVIGLGGSIVSDGGLGMGQALGMQYFDAHGNTLQPANGYGFSCIDLPRVAFLDASGVPRCVLDKQFEILSDVNIPLLGANGQAAIFARQKGATDREVEFIEVALTHWCSVLKKHFGRDVDVPYAGAAGGLGAGLMAFLNGRLLSGTDYVLNALDFDGRMRECDVVVTGEGRLDRTTLLNKACFGVASRCHAARVDYCGIFGRIETQIEPFVDRSVDASLIHRQTAAEPAYFSIRAIKDAMSHLPGY